MKKVISVTLILALVLSLGCLFSACESEKLGLKYAKKDPYAYIQTASEKVEKEISKETDLSKLFNSLTEKGTVTVKADDMSAEVAYNLKKNSAYANVEWKSFFEDYSAEIWYDEDAICMKSEDLLGSDTAYGISFDTLEKDMEDSEIWDILFGDLGDFGDFGDTSEDMGAAEILAAFFAEGGDISELIERYNKTIEKYFDKLEYTVEETTTGEGDKAVEISFTLDSDDLVELLETIEDDVLEDIDLSDLIGVDMDDIIDKAEEIDTEMTFSVVISNKSGLITNATCEYEFSYEMWYGKTDIGVEMDLDMEDLKDITLKVNQKTKNDYGTEKSSVTIKYKNSDSDDKISRKITVKEDGETIAGISFSLDTAKNKLSVQLSDEDENYKLEAKCELSKSKLKLSKMTYTVNGEEEDLPIEELTLSTGYSTKKMPKYTNILRMDEEELEELLGSLIGF